MGKNNPLLINIYVNRFLGDFIPVMPLLGLLLLERGFTLSTISLFFLILSVTVIIAEIPAGVLADAKNPRSIICISRLLKLCALVFLFFATNIYILCLAAILWGLASAFDSGAIQSYLFQFVRQYKSEDAFEHVYGKMFTASLFGLLCAGLLGAQVTRLGFDTLQLIGIGALTISMISTLFFPNLNNFRPADVAIEKKLDYKTYVLSLRQLKYSLVLLLFVGVLAGGTKGSLDEYTAVLLANKELSLGIIGYILFGLEMLKACGASFASRFSVSTRSQIFVLGFLGSLFLVAAFGNSIVTILALIVVVCIDAVLWVHNDAAIQRNASEGNRATLASIKNFGIELLAASIFFVMWLAGNMWSIDILYLCSGVFVLAISVLLFLKYKV